MPPHTTHLCQVYHINEKASLKTIARYIMPLFDLKIIDIKPYLVPRMRQNLFWPKLYKTSKQHNNFSQVLCLSVNLHSSNCRRDKIFNRRRDALLEFFNANLHEGWGFWITLSKINYFVPQEELISQIKKVLESEKEKISYERDLMKNKFSMDVSKVPISHVLQNIMVRKWSSYLHYHFPGKTFKSLFYQQLESSYLQVSILNFYKIRYAKNAQKMYQDMMDFDRMLSKFNFMRFFMASTVLDGQRNQKNCESFIKKLKWRTAETEDYLLFLVRNCSWERNCITVRNFVHLYDTQFKVKAKQVSRVRTDQAR